MARQKKAGKASSAAARRIPVKTQSAAYRAFATVGLFLGIALIVYCQSFQGQFQFDDRNAIQENRSIRALWPLQRVLSPPRDTTVAGRPVLNLSLALSYQLSGLHVWGYHACNLAIHLLASLLLLGVVRRTLLTKGMPPMLGDRSYGIALTTSLLWMIHPIQTSSVTYIVQRAESLMGLFYLLTLYCAIRSFSSTKSAAWQTAAIATCALGMGTKEVMATAPLLVLAYDWVYCSGSLKEALRKSPMLYVGLAGTWLILAGLVATNPRGNAAGLRFADLTPVEYLLTQSEVILHYLRLSLPAAPLCFYYDWPVAKSLTAVAPSVVIVLGLLCASVYALWRLPSIGFIGLWFFLILAPSSSLLPIVTEIAAEHRMYLSLAAVVVLCVLAGNRLIRYALDRWYAPSEAPKSGLTRLAAVVVVLAGALLGYETFQRNLVYRDATTLWEDTVHKQPNNPYAHNNLGFSLSEIGRQDEAIARFAEALRIKPDYADAKYNLGVALSEKGKVKEAITLFAETLKIRPDDVKARSALGQALAKTGQLNDGIFHLKKAVLEKPQDEILHSDLGNALSMARRDGEAIAEYREALRIRPDYAQGHNNLAVLLDRQGRIGEAVAHYTEALRIDPRLAFVHANLAEVYLRIGEYAKAWNEIHLCRSYGGTPPQKLLTSLSAKMPEQK
jgi:tetratricopeptide (TPR) repeat protein